MWTCTLCGRALYVAQHFEKNLRGIAAALELRSTRVSRKFQYSDEDELNAFFDTKLKRSLGKCIKSGLLNHVPQFAIEDFKKHLLPSLGKAREARNRIAHEFLFGIEGIEVPSVIFDEMTESLREDVRILANADFSVCCIIQGFNRAPIPTHEEIYVNSIVSWVFTPARQNQRG